MARSTINQGKGSSGLSLLVDSPSPKRELGNQLELFAQQTLTKIGLTVIATNYLCKMGELDIIAEDGNDLVFIEVRYRKSEAFGGAVGSVTKAKQKRIIKAAEHYLHHRQLVNKVACRFDVFAITGSLQRLNYNWIKAAFT